MKRYSITGIPSSMLRDAGGKDIRVLRRGNIVVATLDDRQVEKLRQLGYAVTEVSKVVPLTAPPTPVEAQPLYTAGELIYALGIEEFRAMTSPPLEGDGFYVAVLGTGIRATHELVGGKVVYSKNYTSSPVGDGFDHDTGVAGIIHTTVPKCGLLDMKVIGDNGEGTEEDVAQAMDDLITKKESNDPYAVHVINLSLGSPDIGDPNSLMRVMCREAINAGIFVFASAGNSGPEPGTITSPACEKYVYAVGSAKYDPFVVSSFSSRGPTKEGLTKPEAAMFGEDMIVASSKSDTATIGKSGTSFSCPFASAACILYLNGEELWAPSLAGMPDWMRRQVPYPMTPSGLIDVFTPQVCIKPSGVSSGKDNNYGYGLPYGPLIAEKFTCRPAIAIEGLVSLMMAIGMMGIMTKVIGK